jgi:hypothetical protein
MDRLRPPHREPASRPRPRRYVPFSAKLHTVKVLRRLRNLVEAVLSPGPTHDRVALAGSWVTTALLTSLALPMMFFGGLGAFWVGVDSRAAVASVVAFLPVVVALAAYFAVRRRTPRRTAWTIAMAVALPATFLPWFIVVVASAM